jgi:hypothetical protein
MQVCAKTLERRRIGRASVLKRAQIVAGSSVFDCFVLDHSSAGVRVSISAPVALPGEVLLRLDDGRIPARSRWSFGTETGLEFNAVA